MARNKAVGEWRWRASWRGPQYGRVVIEQADMLDKQLNQRYVGGAYRVRLTDVPEMRTKTFLGETAWSAAARYASDAASKCGDWRWWPDL